MGMGLETEASHSAQMAAPNDRTKEFIMKAYDAAFHEKRVRRFDLDRNRPYRISGKRYYQTTFKWAGGIQDPEKFMTMMPLPGLSPAPALSQDLASQIKGEPAESEVPREGIDVMHYRYFDKKDKLPKTFEIPIAENLRGSNSALLFLFVDQNDPEQSYQTTPEIGTLFGITRQAVWRHTKKFVERLHGATTNRIRTKFPLGNLSFDRPITLAERLKMNEDGIYEISLHLQSLYSSGTPVDEIVGKVGLATYNKARKFLHGGLPCYSVEMQKERREAIRRFQDLDSDMDMGEARTLIRRFFRTQGVLNPYLHGDKNLFTNVSSLQDEALNNRDPRKTWLVYDFLDKAGFPVIMFSKEHRENGRPEVHSYYYILERYQDQALDVLRESELR